MELLVNPTSYSNALSLIKLGVHQINVGIEKWCVRNSCNLTFEQIKELTKQKCNTKILILVNRFYFDHELNELTKFIKDISKCNIDGFIFTDMAINQICFENKITVPLIYDSETLTTNYEQFPFYLQNNINEVSLPHELNQNEISIICKNKKEMKAQMQVAGHAYVMHSRWKLISNFQKVNKLKGQLTKTKLLIREISRKEPMIIYEDESGSHVLTNYSLSLIDKLNELKNINTIRIDGFLHDEDWLMQTTKVYLKAISAINKNAFNDKLKQELINQLPKEKTSHGFYLMDKQDLIYLTKEGAYE